MNLQPVPVATSGPLTFICLKCHGYIRQANETAWADLDGPAFIAYYHDTCARQLLRERDNERNGSDKA